MRSPVSLLGTLLPKAKSKEHLFELAALMGPPPTDAPMGAPPVAPQQMGGVGPAIAGEAVQPPGMKVPPMPGMNMPNPGNPSIGAALAGG